MGQIIFEYVLYPICFLLLPTSFICIKSFIAALRVLLNDASVDIVDDEGSFQFSPEAEFTIFIRPHHPCNRNYMKVRRENRRGRRTSSHFLLSVPSEARQYTYSITDVDGALSMKDT